MPIRPLLFDAAGNPVAFEATGNERDKAILVECFGALMGLQEKLGEWAQYQGGPQEAVRALLTAIVDSVGIQPLEMRYAAAGLKLTRPGNGAPAAQGPHAIEDSVPPPPHRRVPTKES